MERLLLVIGFAIGVAERLACETTQNDRCENCGSTDDVREVEYDAMVDGPGYVITEQRCAACRCCHGEAA